MRANRLIFSYILVFATPVFSQYGINYEMRPDVTFGEHNDRFDVSDLMNYQNSYFRPDGNTDYRRRHHSGKKRRTDLLTKQYLRERDPLKIALLSRKGRKKLVKKIQKETDEKINKLANEILLRMNTGRRMGEHFALQDDMSPDGGNIADYNENLAKFRTESSKPADANEKQDVGYRKVGTDLEMFKYAFPIDMQVQGYLVPSVH